MTFLGLEQPVAYGRELVFDPTTALMVLNANRDYINAVYRDYQQVMLDMKDFNKEYGDFTSPILADMDWYYNNVTGRIKNFINGLYARGIDPLRSREGRALVTRELATMPTKGIADVRQSAETAREYLKSIDDDTNPEFERFLGRDLSTWSTMGDPAKGIKGNGVWGFSKASKYQDLNKYTSHIFDNIKDSFIGTDKNHYDWYGVTEEHLAKSLTPDKLGGLLNTDLGRFHYLNAIKDLAAQGNLNPTEEQKMEQFRKNVLAANHEKVHLDRKLNELWKMQQENAARRSAGGGGGSIYNRDPLLSFMELIRRGSVSAIFGKQSQLYGPDMLKLQRDVQIEWGKNISNKYKNNSWNKGAVQEFVNHYTQQEYNPAVMAKFVTEGAGVMRFLYGDSPNTIIVRKLDFNRLRTQNDVVSHTAGFRGHAEKTDFKMFKNKNGQYPEFMEVTFTGRPYGAFMKNARNENHFQAVVRAAYRSGEDEKGNPTYTYRPVKDPMYFDSHITSEKADPRAGYLGTYDKKTKTVSDTKGIEVLNDHDSRFQDAVHGDKIISDILTNNTVYGTDAILTELPNWGR